MKNFFTGLFIIWYRDLLRFWRNKTRVLTGFTFPVLWLLVFGNGISASLSLPVPNVKFIQFLFPGVIAQYLIFNSMFSAISILQDREFGFLKEILVSPVNRTAIAIGKVLGGASVAFLQALPILVLAPLVGVTPSFPMVILLLPGMMLLSLCLSSIGVAITARMKSLDAGQYIFQFISFPIVMLSGAFFPLHGLPAWINFFAKLNPVSYAVDLLRRIVFNDLHLPAQVVTMLSPTISGHILSAAQEIGIVLAFTAVLLFFASRAFGKS